MGNVVGNGTRDAWAVINVDRDGNYSPIGGVGSYYNIPCNSTITVPINQNMLVAGSMDVCGTIILQGRIVSVQI